jgi:chitinase
MARNVIYYNQSNSQIPLAGIANLPYTDVILEYLLTDGNLNVYGDGGAFDGNTGNVSNPNDIQTLQNAGKNVLVSFGGDSGTFPSSAWQSCAQNVDTVVNNIVAFVNDNGLNGVDIDYEDDNGFTGGPDGQPVYDGVQFLIALTQGLAQQLPRGQNIITHAPQTPYWYPGTYQAAYQQIWQQVGAQITWFNNQFYDNPDNDATPQLKVQTYHDIVNIPGGPPPQKLLVGAILPNGGQIGTNGIISLDDMVQNVIRPLKNTYGPAFGGAMGWQFAYDQGGNWGTQIGQAVSNLYVFHQGGGNDGQLRFTVFDGTNFDWSADVEFQGIAMSASPSAVRWKDGITVFHQGANNDGQLWYTYYDGVNWGGDTLVPVLALSGSPSAVVYNGQLYVFHQGGGNNGQLQYTVFDGNAWSGDIVIPNVTMSGSPSAVVWLGGITVFHQGANNDGQLWYTYHDGDPDHTWGPDTLVSVLALSESPSAVVFNNQLYVFHQGGGDNGQLRYAAFNGSAWSGDIVIPNLIMSASPSAVAWYGGITGFHQGQDNDGQLWYTFYDGDPSHTWGPDTLVPVLALSGSPSAVVY